MRWLHAIEELKIPVPQDRPQNILRELMQCILGHNIVAVPWERRYLWIGRLANLNHSYILTDFHNDCQAFFRIFHLFAKKKSTLSFTRLW